MHDTGLQITHCRCHALPALFTALRLPGFQHHWERFAQQADTGHWPAARLLATLAGIELAEREERRSYA